MSPLDNLLADMEADTRAITPEVVLLAFQILDRKRAEMIEELKHNTSRSKLLENYKRILNQYAAYKILWHRWARRHEYDQCFHREHWSRREHWRYDSDNISVSIRKYKTDLMSIFEKVKAVFPGITYRELNKLSLGDLMAKWLGKYA